MFEYNNVLRSDLPNVIVRLGGPHPEQNDKVAGRRVQRLGPTEPESR